MKWVKIGIEWRAWNGVVTYLEAFYEVIRMDGFQRGWDLWVGQTDDWPSVFQLSPQRAPSVTLCANKPAPLWTNNQCGDSCDTTLSSVFLSQHP